jgi:hypothetical protein
LQVINHQNWLYLLMLFKLFLIVLIIIKSQLNAFVIETIIKV